MESTCATNNGNYEIQFLVSSHDTDLPNTFIIKESSIDVLHIRLRPLFNAFLKSIEMCSNISEPTHHDKSVSTDKRLRPAKKLFRKIGMQDYDFLILRIFQHIYENTMWTEEIDKAWRFFDSYSSFRSKFVNDDAPFLYSSTENTANMFTSITDFFKSV